ncbi:MAG: triose-phosphate isomerase [Verrucomicrobia bacterium]|nr:triose-phosphate isomerase [Verrucomicrobiota bacterium]
MAKIPVIAGNWKMYKSAEEAALYIAALKAESLKTERRILLAVPFTAIDRAAQAARGTPFSIGAQNMHDAIEGAFTGEISASMLLASGAEFVLLGHSERRQHFLETNSFIQRKLLRALSTPLTPILCIGETLPERERGDHEKVLILQLEECLQGVENKAAERLLIAYEPVWAIGTGKTATPEIAGETHQMIRNWLLKRFGKESAQKISLLYGGSVKPESIASLMAEPDIDGVLVGGASLDPKVFTQLINY